MAGVRVQSAAAACKRTETGRNGKKQAEGKGSAYTVFGAARDATRKKEKKAEISESNAGRAPAGTRYGVAGVALRAPSCGMHVRNPLGRVLVPIPSCRDVQGFLTR